MDTFTTFLCTLVKYILYLFIVFDMYSLMYRSVEKFGRGIDV